MPRRRRRHAAKAWDSARIYKRCPVLKRSVGGGEQAPLRIRVLYLDPAWNLDDPLFGEFEAGLLTEWQGKFDALSYTWQPPFDDQVLEDDFIEVQNGVEIPITGNLGRALRRLRFQHKWFHIVWVDAICINQQNPEEQAQQVQHMAEIYSSAHKVVAWIGEDSSMQDGKHIFELCQVLEYGEDETFCGLYHPRRGVFTRHNDALWEVFASRKYFTRLWIVQELVHAGRIKFICGSAETEFATLLVGMHLALGAGISWSGISRYSYRSSTALRYRSPSSTVLQALQLMRSIDDTRTARKCSTPLPDLSRDSESDQGEPQGISCTRFSEVLYELQHLTCSDERDRIYATMSLSNETKTKVAVDYTIDCAQAYYNLAKVIYTDDMLLVAASQHAIGVPRNDDFPSWIPDWRLESRKPQSEADEIFSRPPLLFRSGFFPDTSFREQEKETNDRDFVSFNDSEKRLTIRLLCFGRVLTSDTTHNDGHSYSLHVRNFEPYRSAKGTSRAAQTLLKQGDYICQHTYKKHRYPQTAYFMVLRAVDDPGHDVFLLDGPLDTDTVCAVRLVGLVRCVPRGALDALNEPKDSDASRGVLDALTELKDADAKHQEFWIV